MIILDPVFLVENEGEACRSSTFTCRFTNACVPRAMSWLAAPLRERAAPMQDTVPIEGSTRRRASVA